MCRQFDAQDPAGQRGYWLAELLTRQDQTEYAIGASQEVRLTANPAM